jgi:DNA-binding YbaB/EbfC family protein
MNMPEMPDFEEIMKMAQNAQAELQMAQDNLDTIEVEGAAGGGLVKIRATAKGRIMGVSLDDSLLQPSEKTMLEDLIAAALNDAKAKADTAAATELQKMQSGLPLPPGFKMPF